MKKYVKPELIYERYELSQNIAACAWDMNAAKEDSACVGTADPSIFGDSMTGKLFAEGRGCYYLYDDGEQYCYHNGTQYNNIFDS